jgi:hypothetical protein
MRKKSRLRARASKSVGAKPKAGTKNPEFKAAREAREAAGTSRYAAPVTEELNDTEELDGAAAAASLVRAQTLVRVQRLRANAAAKAARLAAASATEPPSSPLASDELSEPATVDSAQPRAPKEKSLKRKRQRDNKAAKEAIEQLLKKLGEHRGTQALMAELRTPAMTKLLAAAGFDSLENSSLDKQMVDSIRDAAVTLKGKRTDDAQRALQALFTFVQSGDTPVKRGAAARGARSSSAPPSVRSSSPHADRPPKKAGLEPSKIAKRLCLSKSTASRHAKMARVTRRRLNELDSKACIIDMKQRRKGQIKATDEVIEAVFKFISEHPHVRASPSKKDTVLIRGTDGRRDQRVPRMLIEISRTQLYLEFCRRHTNINIGERTFRSLFPKNFRRLTKRYESCGCTTCLEIAAVHQSLVMFRGKVKKSRNVPNYNPPDHAKASDAVYCVLCPCVVVESRPEGERDLRISPAPCWMGRCTECGVGRRYEVPSEEARTDEHALRIKVTVFEYLPDPCEHKPDRTTKKKVTKTMAIGAFMNDIYLPKLTNYAYHLCLLRALDLCRRQRLVLKIGDVMDLRDFAEKLSAAFENAPQDEHWQNVVATIETAVIEAFAKDATVGSASKDEQHFCISDYKKQDAAVVHRNMDEVIADLLARGKLREHGTIKQVLARERATQSPVSCATHPLTPPHARAAQMTDGCGAQYWCARAVHLLSKLSKKYKINIDRMRSAPGHGKSKADGAHAVLKVFCRAVMAMEDKQDDSKPILMNAAASVDGAATSFAAEVVAVLNAQKSECVTGGMNSKRQRLAKTESRHYHLYGEEDVSERFAVDFKAIDPASQDEKKRKLAHSSWKAYHNVRLDWQLEADECMLRRWPCGCGPCVAQLGKAKAERYKTAADCELRELWGGLNGWIKRKVDAQSGGDELDELDGDGDADLDRLIVDQAERRAAAIKVDDNGAIPSRDDPAYYLVKFKSVPYALAEPIETEWGTLEEGRYVVDFVYYWRVFAVSNELRWWTLNPNDQVKQMPTDLIVHASFEMEKASCAKEGRGKAGKAAAAVRDGAVVLAEVDHEIVLDEIADRDDA